jgi:D-cysteine desulfhydrase
MAADHPFPTDALLRVRLAQLPTPIEHLPRLSAHLGGPDVYVKRDDQTGLATGGNKTRKLEFLIAAALEDGADCVITAGSTQSNHARQTAAAARRVGLEPYLVLFTPDGQPPGRLTGNVLIDTLLGARIHWTAERAPYKAAIRQVEAGLLAAGRRPYVVPYGGSNAVGLMGYVEAMREVVAQMEQTGPFDAHVFATSSGGTQAGMILGAYLTGLLGQTRLLGISIDEREATLGPRVANLVNDAARALGLEWRVNDDVADINDDYLGGGYAVVGDLEREAIRLLAEQEGLLADPVYTGRAFGGLVDLIRRGELTRDQRVLFWHTGGVAALFAFEEQLR